MKIILILRGSTLKGGGGAERRFTRLFNYLYHKEDELFLLINKKLYLELINSGLIDINNTNVIYYDRGDSIIKFNLWLIKMVRILRADVIHLVLIQRSLIPFYFWLMLKRKISVVTTVASSGLGLGGKINITQKIIAYLLFIRSNLIDSLYPSFPNTKLGAKFSSKITITPNSFTDLDLYRPGEKRQVIAFCGRLIPEKNPHLIVEAIKLINERNPGLLDGWKIIILGYGPLETKLRIKIEQYGLKKLFSIERKWSSHTVLNESMIFLSLQSTDNYPSQSLLEAMASGNAIVASDAGHTRLLVKETFGKLIDLTQTSLAKAIEELLENKEEIRLMGIKARNYITEYNNINLSAKYFLEIWSRAMN